MNIYEEIVLAAMNDSSVYAKKGDKSDGAEIKAVFIDKLLSALQMLSSLDMISADGELLGENGKPDSCKDFGELMKKIEALKEKTINLHDDIVNMATFRGEPSTLSKEEQIQKAEFLLTMLQEYSIFAKVGRVSLDGALTSADGKILLDANFEDLYDEACEIWQNLYGDKEN